MKKSIILVLLAVLIMPFLCACDNGKKHLDVYESVNEFLALESTTQILNGTVSYGNKINNEKNTTSSKYYILNSYDELLKLTYIPLIQFKGCFDGATPFKNRNAETSLCSSFCLTYDNFIVNLNSFNNKKQSFINTIENTSSDLIATDELNTFKKEYGKLIIKANDCQRTFMNTYNNLYGGVDANQNIASSKNAVGAFYSEVLNDYINFAINEFNYTLPNTTIYDYTNYKTNLITLSTKLNNTTTEFTSTNFTTWANYYENYLNEQKIFLQNLNSVNLMQDNTLATGATKTQLNQVEKFIEEFAPFFITKTIELLGE